MRPSNGSVLIVGGLQSLSYAAFLCKFIDLLGMTLVSVPMCIFLASQFYLKMVACLVEEGV